MHHQSLSIRTPEGQAHERVTERAWGTIMDYFKGCTRKATSDTHPADAIIQRAGVPVALIEIKSRRDFDERTFWQRHRGEWLITAHKLDANEPIAAALRVPFHRRHAHRAGSRRAPQDHLDAGRRFLRASSPQRRDASPNRRPQLQDHAAQRLHPDGRRWCGSDTEAMSRGDNWAHQDSEFKKHRSDRARALFWTMRTGKTKAVLDKACFQFKKLNIKGLIVLAPNGVHVNWVVNELPRWVWEDVGEWQGFAWEMPKRGDPAWACVV
jgi:hypothetical protein